MPDPTYESEINQSVHRPGMEKVVNREEPRHVVSPATRSAFGADSESSPAPKSTPKDPAPPQAPASPGSGIGGRQRTDKILEQVDAMS